MVADFGVLAASLALPGIVLTALRGWAALLAVVTQFEFLFGMS